MVAACKELIALVLGILNQFKHALILRLVLNGANGRALFGAIANLDRFGISRNRARQFVVNIFVNVDTLGRDADLARIVEACPKQLFSHLANVGIGQNNRRVIAAQFKRDALKVLRRRFHHALARGSRTREGNLVDIRMRRQQWAQRVATGDDVQNAGWEYARHQFSKAQGRQRREWRRLQHHGAA